MKRILVLGAGLVSRPLVTQLAGDSDLVLTVADVDAGRAESVLPAGGRHRPIALAADDEASLARCAQGAHLIVSLLPYPLHPKVARVAIAQRVPLVTTSYVAPEMRALHASAAQAGIVILNEVGLDPGLDHMSAMRTIGRFRRAGARLVSFSSCCGGLPAPEANTNPWGYKFSWSPKGVLAAGRNPARWLEDGRLVEVDGASLFTHAAPYDVPGVGRFEVYPNRDATVYASLYGLEGIATMFRGTLRYPGWCATLDALSRLGLLRDEPHEEPERTTYAQLMEVRAVPGTAPLPHRIAARLGLGPDDEVIRRLEFAGLFSDTPLPHARIAPIDALCARLAETLVYRPGERDMIVLRHEFGIEERDGNPERHVATLVAYGVPGGDSAMARTVSLPAAIAARLILEGRIRSTGVRIPVDPEVFDPVLDALEPLGIVFRESRTAP